MLDLVFQNFTTDKQFNENFFKKILETTSGELDLKEKNISVSLNLVREGKIKELNKKYRHKNKVTDVLSFPMEEGGDMGDIFICLSIAKKEAKRENIDIEN